MGKSLLVLLAFAAGFGLIGMTLQKLEEDVFPTPAGELKIFFVGHGSLFLTCGGKVVHIDPVASEGDYARLPKADLVLVTHEHGDHLDPEAIRDLRRDGTQVVVSPACAGKIADAVVMKNGDRRTLPGHRGRGRAGLQPRSQKARRDPLPPEGTGQRLRRHLRRQRRSISRGTRSPSPKWRR